MNEFSMTTTASNIAISKQYSLCTTLSAGLFEKLKLSNINNLIFSFLIFTICISTFRVIFPSFVSPFTNNLGERLLKQEQTDDQLYGLRILNNYALSNLQSSNIQVQTADNGDRIILIYFCENKCYTMSYIILIFRLNEFVVLSSANDLLTDLEVLTIDNSTITNSTEELKQHLNVTSTKYSFVNILSKYIGNLFDKIQVSINIEYDLTLNTTNITKSFISNITNIQAKIETSDISKYDQAISYAFNMSDFNPENSEKITLQTRANMFNAFYSLILLFYFVTLRNIILEFQDNPLKKENLYSIHLTYF